MAIFVRIGIDDNQSLRKINIDGGPAGLIP